MARTRTSEVAASVQSECLRRDGIIGGLAPVLGCTDFSRGTPVTREQAQIGTRVRSLVEFSGVPKGMSEYFDSLYIPEPNSGCWLWMGSISRAGYGWLNYGGLSVYAHRFSYIRKHGSIPAQCYLDHLCRVHCCVNPSHLEAVSPRTNSLRGIGPKKIGELQSGKSHCKNGHIFDEENTRWMPGKKGRPYRACRSCARRNQQRFRNGGTRARCLDCNSELGKSGRSVRCKVCAGRALWVDTDYRRRTLQARKRR